MELFSPGHLIVLAIVVAVLFFGYKQLPDMARSAGRSLRVFRTELKGMTDDDAVRDAARAAAAPASEPPSAAAPPTVPAPPAVTSPTQTAAADDVSVTDGPGKAAG